MKALSRRVVDPVLYLQALWLRLFAALMLNLLALVGISHAAIDVSTITGGINDAQTAIVAVVGALLALSVAIFGIVKVYRFVSRKSGA